MGYILIVEDSAHVATAIKDLIELMGHESLIAETGQQALEVLTQEPYPDLVMLDWMLPDAEGIDILRHIRSSPMATTPVIMLTAKGELNSRLTGLEAGADDYVAKPFNVKELQARITAVMRRAG